MTYKWRYRTSENSESNEGYKGEGEEGANPPRKPAPYEHQLDLYDPYNTEWQAAHGGLGGGEEGEEEEEEVVCCALCAKPFDGKGVEGKMLGTMIVVVVMCVVVVAGCVP
jgi:hypothetical protein